MSMTECIKSWATVFFSAHVDWQGIFCPMHRSTLHGPSLIDVPCVIAKSYAQSKIDLGVGCVAWGWECVVLGLQPGGWAGVGGWGAPALDTTAFRYGTRLPVLASQLLMQPPVECFKLLLFLSVICGAVFISVHFYIVQAGCFRNVC